MTADGFRRIALEMPLAEEGSHMGQADFRVAGKIFASLPRAPVKTENGAARGRSKAPRRPAGPLGMVKLTPEQQRAFAAERRRAFVPVGGAWGARGATFVVLKEVDARTLRRAMKAAWEATAPKRVLKEFEGDGAE